MYPLDGSDLVPSVLQPFIGATRLAPRLASRLGLDRSTTLGGIKRADLNSLSGPVIRELVHTTRRALTAAMQDVRQSNLPVAVPFIPVDLARDRLSLRAFNIAFRGELLASPWGNEVPLGVVASQSQMGPASLLEVLALLEAVARENAPTSPAEATGPEPEPGILPEARISPQLGISRAVEKTARKLLRRRWAPLVLRDDPRLGVHFKGLGAAADARELGRGYVGRPLTRPEARSVNARLKKLIRAGDGLRRLTIEDEARQIIDALITTSPSGRDALAARLGLLTGSPCTLAAAGETVGMTRERVRQVEARFTDAARKVRPWTPALDRAIALVGASGVARIEGINREFVEVALTTRLTLPAVLALAQAFDAPELAVEVDTDLGVAYASGFPLDEIAREAKRLATHWGTTTVEEVAAGLDSAVEVDGAAVRTVLNALGGFEWLDPEETWFWAPRAARNRLLNQIEKIMSVAGSIDLGELRAGVGRFHRMEGFRPPREVLARLCVASGLYRREGDRIIGNAHLRPWEDVLGRNERLLVEVLFEHGPVMRREDLERIACDERGLNRSSFYVYLTYSPFLARFAPGVFGLRGAQVGAAEVKALIPPRVRVQRLRRHGWTDDRKIWVAYDISKASTHSGVLTLPSELRDVISGSFTLRAEDARPVGTLVIRGVTMWGLSPFFRRWGVEEGDLVLITIDPLAAEATIVAGTEELLLRHQSGE